MSVRLAVAGAGRWRQLTAADPRGRRCHRECRSVGLGPSMRCQAGSVRLGSGSSISGRSRAALAAGQRSPGRQTSPHAPLRPRPARPGADLDVWWGRSVATCVFFISLFYSFVAHITHTFYPKRSNKRSGSSLDKHIEYQTQSYKSHKNKRCCGPDQRRFWFLYLSWTSRAGAPSKTSDKACLTNADSQITLKDIRVT